MPKIILCHCTCVIVINVDTCNEHDTTLNHTKSKKSGVFKAIQAVTKFNT